MAPGRLPEVAQSGSTPCLPGDRLEMEDFHKSPQLEVLGFTDLMRLTERTAKVPQEIDQSDRTTVRLTLVKCHV